MKLTLTLAEQLLLVRCIERMQARLGRILDEAAQADEDDIGVQRVREDVEMLDDLRDRLEWKP